MGSTPIRGTKNESGGSFDLFFTPLTKFYYVMVAYQILVLRVQVRILIELQKYKQ